MSGFDSKTLDHNIAKMSGLDITLAIWSIQHFPNGADKSGFIFGDVVLRVFPILLIETLDGFMTSDSSSIYSNSEMVISIGDDMVKSIWRNQIKKYKLKEFLNE